MARSGALIMHAAQGGQSAAIPPLTSLYMIIAACALFVIPGWFAYTGKWRRWTASARGRAFPYAPFGMTWMGAGAVLVGVFGLLSALGSVAGAIAAIVFALPGFVLFFCGLAFAIRTPRRFLPPWYREYRDHVKGRR
jgi:UPF0716 family protein affecting phage T7 exclusion